MSVLETIEQLVRQRAPDIVALSETANLYEDCGLDSVSFVSLIVDIEDYFGIRFAISEMELALVVTNLINMIGEKLSGGGI